MEKIEQGTLKILKGDNFLTIKKDFDIGEWNEDLWSFIDGLIGKGYELMSVTVQGYMVLVTLKKV